jgi:hypothetical protein
MPRRIFLDIETLPPGEDFRTRVKEEVVCEMAEQEVLITQPELDILVDERFRGFALRPEYGRILAIGLIVEDGDRVIHQGVLGRERETGRFHLDEERTLKSFWKLLSGFNANHDVLVGHNLLDFDLQFLCKRSVIHRVKPSFDICFARYRQRPVYDTMWEWNHWSKKISLHELAEVLGIKSPKIGGLDGGQVYNAYHDGRHEDIAQYCMRDVECAREVYYRLNFLEPPPLKKYSAKIVTEVSRTAEINYLAA